MGEENTYIADLGIIWGFHIEFSWLMAIKDFLEIFRKIKQFVKWNNDYNQLLEEKIFDPFIVVKLQLSQNWDFSLKWPIV